MLPDYLKHESEGREAVGTLRNILSKALEYDLISDYDVWAELSKLRNAVIHEYLPFGEVVAELHITTEKAYPEFKNIYDYLKSKSEEIRC